jgi:hypothetical protein
LKGTNNKAFIIIRNCNMAKNLKKQHDGPNILWETVKKLLTFLLRAFASIYLRFHTCYHHVTKLQCWLKTFTQHCEWGEGGNSKKRSNYMSVDVSKWKKSLKYVKSHYFCTWLYRFWLAKTMLLLLSAPLRRSQRRISKCLSTLGLY